jgi:uncharacterized protein
MFRSYNDHLRARFGGRTYKVTVASGLTCPTRDGTIAKRGCAFCDVRGSSSFFGKQGRGASVREQLEKRMVNVRSRFSADHCLAYFQSYTNTYTTDLEYLREIYEAALGVEGISGLCVGTRPDCLPDPVLDLLEELAQRAYVSLELGVQSFEDPALEWLVRGHDGACSIDALERVRRRAPHVQVCVHLMFGSPPDSPTAPRDAALLLNRLGVHGAKLHQVMVLEHTDLAERYRSAPFPTLSLEEYAGQVAQFLEHLSPEIYLERLYALATHPDELVAPKWSADRWGAHNGIRRLLEERGCRQGAALAPLALRPHQPELLAQAT